MKSKKLIQIKSSRQSKEGGAVLMELALIVPMLTFLILSVTDFGMFLQSYFQVCHIAREGLRTAVAVPDLKGSVTNYSGTYVATTDTSSVLAFSPGTGLTNEHRFIQDRILMLLKADNGTAASHSLQLVNNAVEIRTRCQDNGGVQGADRVEVEVLATYQPITPFNNMLAAMNFSPLTFNFRTKAEGAYLFNNCAP